MKRYQVKAGVLPGQIGQVILYLHPNGIWCRAEDVEKELQGMQEEIDELKAELMKRIEPKEKETTMAEPKLRLKIRDEKPEPPVPELEFWLEQDVDGSILLNGKCSDGKVQKVARIVVVEGLYNIHHFHLEKGTALWKLSWCDSRDEQKTAVE